MTVLCWATTRFDLSTRRLSVWWHFCDLSTCCLSDWWYFCQNHIWLMALLSEPPLTGGAISQIDFCIFIYQWFWSGWEVLPSDNQEQEEECEMAPQRDWVSQQLDLLGSSGFSGRCELLISYSIVRFTAASFGTLRFSGRCEAVIYCCLHHSACCGHFACTEYHWNSK